LIDVKKIPKNWPVAGLFDTLLSKTSLHLELDRARHQNIRDTQACFVTEASAHPSIQQFFLGFPLSTVKWVVSTIPIHPTGLSHEDTVPLSCKPREDPDTPERWP